MVPLGGVPLCNKHTGFHVFQALWASQAELESTADKCGNNRSR